MKKYLIFLVILVLLTGSVFGQDWELTETWEIAFPISPSRYGFTINYPAGWFADKDGRLVFLNELEVDHQRALGDELFLTEGLSVYWELLSPKALGNLGLPTVSERTMKDLLYARGYQESMIVSETVFYRWPALEVRTEDDMGNHISAFFGYLNDAQSFAFAITLVAPSADALDAFLPIFFEMLPEQVMFPEPTGPYQIGTTERHWIDDSREEIFTSGTYDKREIMVRFWYPAEVDSQATPAPYYEIFEGSTGDDILDVWTPFGLPISNLGVQDALQRHKHAFLDVPVSNAEEQYPILIFSPGYGVIPESYAIQLEELASHGYIVVGISQPYCSGVTVFPDERSILDAASYGLSITEDLGNECAEDILFVLDQLEQLNQADQDGAFTGRLDLNRIGVFGHSLGGVFASIAAVEDERILAVVNEDAPWIRDGVTQPLLNLPAANRPGKSLGLNITVSIDDIGHRSFTDAPVWLMHTDDIIGTLHGNRSVNIIRTYVLDFFDKYVKGEDSGLLDGPSEEFPEVEIEITGS